MPKAPDKVGLQQLLDGDGNRFSPKWRQSSSANPGAAFQEQEAWIHKVHSKYGDDINQHKRPDCS